MKIEKYLTSIMFEGLSNVDFKYRSDYVRSFDDYGEYIEIVLADHINIERGFICNIYCNFSTVDNIDTEYKQEVCQSYSDMLLVYSKRNFDMDGYVERVLTFYR